MTTTTRTQPILSIADTIDTPFTIEQFSAALSAAREHAAAMVLRGNALTVTMLDGSEGRPLGIEDAAEDIARNVFERADAGCVDDHVTIENNIQAIVAAYLLGIAAAQQFPDLFGGLAAAHRAMAGVR